MACAALLCGPVRAIAAERFVELALLGRDEAGELAAIFAEVERLGGGEPTLSELTDAAARALAAHARRCGRSLAASMVAIAAELDRRFSACASGQAAYPLRLAGLGVAGRAGLDADRSRFCVTHALERIVEAALLVATLVEPDCAPGAYAVTSAPLTSTRAEVRALLAGALTAEQNATIDFALEEYDRARSLEAVAFEHLQCVVLALCPAVDLQELVAHAHALLSAIDAEVELDAELDAAAGVLAGSGLATVGTLALGEAVGAITRFAAGLVSSLHRTCAGGDAAGQSAELARSVLQVALVVAWCHEHGRVRPGRVVVACRAGG